MNKDKTLVGNEKIEEDIKFLKDNFTDEALAVVLTTIRKRILENGQFVVAVDVTNGADNMSLKTMKYSGKDWFIAYTSFEEEMKGSLNVMSGFLADIGGIFEIALKSDDVEGVIINPFGNMMTVNKAIIKVIKG